MEKTVNYLATNQGVGRSNRSGRAKFLKQYQTVRPILGLAFLFFCLWIDSRYWKWLTFSHVGGKLRIVAPCLLGAVERLIGCHQQTLCAASVLRVQSPAYAGADLALEIGKRHRFR